MCGLSGCIQAVLCYVSLTAAPSPAGSPVCSRHSRSFLVAQQLCKCSSGVWEWRANLSLSCLLSSTELMAAWKTLQRELPPHSAGKKKNQISVARNARFGLDIPLISSLILALFTERKPPWCQQDHNLQSCASGFGGPPHPGCVRLD